MAEIVYLDVGKQIEDFETVREWLTCVSHIDESEMLTLWRHDRADFIRRCTSYLTAELDAPD